MGDVVRWGIVGTGRIAGKVAGEFAHVPGARLVAAGSRDAGRARAFADRHGIPGAHGRYASLLADGVDAVYIATPHPQHRDIALAAIDAGVAVLVEKAFTATVEGAEAVVAAARARGVFCMEAMWTRFLPAVEGARRAVRAGEVGEIRQALADLGAFRAYDPADRLFDPGLGGGATLDLGVYPLSLVQHFMGEPDAVDAHGGLAPNGVDMSFGALLRYPGGRAAVVTAGFDVESPARAVLVGTGGAVEIGPPFHHPSRVRVAPRGGESYVVEGEPLGLGYAHQLIEVTRCVRDGRTESDVMPLDDTLAVQRMMAAVCARLGVRPAEADVEV